MKKTIFKLILIFLLPILSSNILSNNPQQKDTLIETIERFYKFHLSKDTVFSKKEIYRRKKFFTKEFYTHLMLEWKRDLEKRKPGSILKPTFVALPFQPIGEVCGNHYKINKPIKTLNRAKVKVDFYYNEDCGNNQFILTFEFQLLKIKNNWLIDDIDNLKSELLKLRKKEKTNQKN